MELYVIVFTPTYLEVLDVAHLNYCPLLCINSGFCPKFLRRSHKPRLAGTCYVAEENLILPDPFTFAPSDRNIGAREEEWFGFHF